MKQLKEIPDFKTEDEEFGFWATHDTTDYIDWSKSKEVSFPNLKPTEGIVSLVLDDDSARELRWLAKERAVDLTVLAAQYVREGIRRDAHHTAR